MNRTPSIKLFELGPTRSARCRWTLLEAGLEYESIGNRPDIIGSEELRKVHPLGKLPAAIIEGRPLFESAAISTAIADLVPEKDLVAKPGTCHVPSTINGLFRALPRWSPGLEHDSTLWPLCYQKITRAGNHSAKFYDV